MQIDCAGDTDEAVSRYYNTALDGVHPEFRSQPRLDDDGERHLP